MPMKANPTYELSSGTRLVFATPEVGSSFFGYYDKSPLDASGTRLLAHRSTFDGRDPTAADEVDVGYYSLPDAAWHSIGITAAFNWQQGSMLQWLGPDFQSRIIYNVRRKDRFGAVIFDIATQTSRELSYPVYAVHPSGTFALGVNYERLYFFRNGYNYQGVNRPEWNVPIHPDDGIFRIDLTTGDHRLLLSTSAVASLFGDLPMGDRHWVEHMMWNPSGSRFLFLYRHGNGAAYATKLLSADHDGGNLYRFCEADLYSHTGWRNDADFVIYANRPNRVYQTYLQHARNNAVWMQPLRAAARCARRYLLSQRNFKRITHGYYYLQSDQAEGSRPIAADHLRDDGHPTWTRNGQFMLTDTYADENGYRHLLIYNHLSGHLNELGRFFSPFNCCGFRCDLHPRFSRDEKSLIIDSAHTGHRQVLVMDINYASIV